MKNLKISKELFKEVLGEEVIETGSFNYPTLEINVQRYSYREWQRINIYEFAYLNLKQWAKLKNVFDKIDWSEEPEQIFKKAEELRNEIN